MLCYLLRFVYIFFILTVYTSISYGDIYKYTDSKGVIHYTKAPVDLRFKKFMTETRPSYNKDDDSADYDDKYTYEPLSFQEIIRTLLSDY